MVKDKIKYLTSAFLLFFALISLYPLVWSLYSALKNSTEILASPLALPKGLYYQNFTNAIVKAKMGDYFINSIVITVLSVVLTLSFSVPTSYAITRYDFPGRKIIKKIFIAGLFVQATIYVVPLFLLLSSLHMLNNRIVLCFVYAASSLPFTVYLLTGFIKGIPVEFEEAARIDGSSHLRTLIEVVMPLLKPAMVTVVIFQTLGFFNEFPIAFTLLSDENKKTLPLGLSNLMEVQRYATDWGALFAGLAIVTIPTIILYIFTQKKLTEGVSMGGLKG